MTASRIGEYAHRWWRWVRSGVLRVVVRRGRGRYARFKYSAGVSPSVFLVPIFGFALG